MPFFQGIDTVAAPTGAVVHRTPKAFRSKTLKPDALSLESIYRTDPLVLEAADDVWIEVTMEAYQIHPATVAELAALGPVGGENAKRWTVEGPLYHRPGDPGAGRNCTITVEITTSLSSDPGDNWRTYEAGVYRARSVKARLKISRPSTAYSWRVGRFTVSAARIPPPQRGRVVRPGVVDVVPSGMSRTVVRNLRVSPDATLRIESDAFLKII